MRATANARSATGPRRDAGVDPAGVDLPPGKDAAASNGASKPASTHHSAHGGGDGVISSAGKVGVGGSGRGHVGWVGLGFRVMKGWAAERTACRHPSVLRGGGGCWRMVEPIGLG